jgi:AcrR family transcriptional regulator
VGRPRAQGPSSSGLTPRQEVLGAAAELFTTFGYAATSTRAVAERAGMRQASLYHYFPSKADILAALLEGTVRPSLDTARRLTAAEGSPEARLWALCRSDVELLCTGPHNLGALYLSPEVDDPRCEAFRRMRSELKDAYRGLLAATAPGSCLDDVERGLRADLLFALVEGVILARREKPGQDLERFPDTAADSALRLAGCPDHTLPPIRRDATRLLRALEG